MAKSKRRRSDHALRPPMRSPGRPPASRRTHRRRFWEGASRGLSSEEAGVEACVSPAVGTRWFRERGGMPPLTLRPLSGRYLSFVEREEIALLHARGCGVREIARRLGRSPSTISRELRRDAAVRPEDPSVSSVYLSLTRSSEAVSSMNSPSSRASSSKNFSKGHTGTTTAQPRRASDSAAESARDCAWYDPLIWR